MFIHFQENVEKVKAEICDSRHNEHAAFAYVCDVSKIDNIKVYVELKQKLLLVECLTSDSA